jgi:hypothetical protein
VVIFCETSTAKNAKKTLLKTNAGDANSQEYFIKQKNVRKWSQWSQVSFRTVLKYCFDLFEFFQTLFLQKLCCTTFDSKLEETLYFTSATNMS